MKKRLIILVITIVCISILGLIFAYNISHSSKSIGKVNENVQNSIEENEILFTVSSSASYDEDPRIPENLLDMVDTHILKIKVLEILDGEILPKMKHYYNPYQTCTPIKVELIENIYGEEISLKENIIYMTVGKIRISNLIKHLDSVDIDRMGLDTLTQEEQENKFIKYSSEFSYDIKEGEEYTIIVGKMDEGIYKIIEEGCGIFVTDNIDTSTKLIPNTTINNDNEIVLKNVVTNVKVNQTELIQKAEEKK